MRAFESPAFAIPGLGALCRLAVEDDEVRGAAVLDGDGKTIIPYGAIPELNAIGEHAVARALDPAEAARLFAGDAIKLALRDERHAFVGIASRALFVVIVDDRDEVVARRMLVAVRGYRGAGRVCPARSRADRGTSRSQWDGVRIGARARRAPARRARRHGEAAAELMRGYLQATWVKT